ncbi:hypothetical protein FPV67DRAFT_739284 [Lyophyllum atratum]|nr:hypothetical protein FPV67DRAFT_739284 [Lyophyllum atratum]
MFSAGAGGSFVFHGPSVPTFSVPIGCGYRVPLWKVQELLESPFDLGVGYAHVYIRYSVTRCAISFLLHKPDMPTKSCSTFTTKRRRFFSLSSPLPGNATRLCIQQCTPTSFSVHHNSISVFAPCLYLDFLVFKERSKTSLYGLRSTPGRMKSTFWACRQYCLRRQPSWFLCLSLHSFAVQPLSSSWKLAYSRILLSHGVPPSTTSFPVVFKHSVH